MKKLLLCIIVTLFSVNLFAACPAMRGYKKQYYYVDEERFDSYAKAKAHIRSLKEDEFGGRKLEVSKKSTYRYTTKWIFQGDEHGYFCVCPDCRFTEDKKGKRKLVQYNPRSFSLNR